MFFLRVASEEQVIVEEIVPAGTMPGTPPPDLFHWQLPAADSAVVRSADDARALLAESIGDDLGAIGPYIAPVELRDGKVVPGNLRERIRVKGLTIELLPVPA